MAYTQIEAVKAIIAMKLYAKKHGGNYPDSLESLVPEVLNRRPIDYMNGQNLRYSPAKHWFYSLGANLQDDSGSASTCYFNRCFWGLGCKDNPTFPLDLSVCDFSEVND